MQTSSCQSVVLNEENNSLNELIQGNVDSMKKAKDIVNTIQYKKLNLLDKLRNLNYCILKGGDNETITSMIEQISSHIQTITCLQKQVKVLVLDKEQIFGINSVFDGKMFKGLNYSVEAILFILEISVLFFFPEFNKNVFIGISLLISVIPIFFKNICSSIYLNDCIDFCQIMFSIKDSIIIRIYNQILHSMICYKEDKEIPQTFLLFEFHNNILELLGMNCVESFPAIEKLLTLKCNNFWLKTLVKISETFVVLSRPIIRTRKYFKNHNKVLVHVSSSLQVLFAFLGLFVCKIGSMNITSKFTESISLLCCFSFFLLSLISEVIFNSSSKNIFNSSFDDYKIMDICDLEHPYLLIKYSNMCNTDCNQSQYLINRFLFDYFCSYTFSEPLLPENIRTTVLNKLAKLDFYKISREANSILCSVIGGLKITNHNQNYY